MYFKNIIILILLSSIILLVTVSLCASGNIPADLILKESDLPGLNLTNPLETAISWPVVQELPDYMQNPENPSSTAGYNSYPATGTAVLSSTSVEGIRQQWSDSNNQALLTVDYAKYNSPEDAQKGLLYMVYKGTQTGGYDYYSNYYNYIPTCRKINFGDLSYWVTTPYGGGILYFTKGPYYFMVDSYQQTIEDQAAQKLLEKVEPLFSGQY